MIPFSLNNKVLKAAFLSEFLFLFLHASIMDLCALPFALLLVLFSLLHLLPLQLFEGTTPIKYLRKSKGDCV